MQKLLLIACFTLLSFNIFSQKITGVITNTDNKPIPFATIYINELQTGTCANQQGKYFIQATPGTYTISFRSMGYTPQEKKVTVINKDVVLNIQLGLQSYILSGVTVRADGEDPAYSIMRKVIARVPAFLNQTESYTSDVYIKGSIKIDHIPKLLKKSFTINGVPPIEGKTYVNESINKIRFKAPDNYTQEVISVNNSFPVGSGDIPVMEMISGSIYESEDDFYISPFAPNAFSHYKFKYEGLLQDGAWFIDKIKVIPKRKSKLLMEGYLYIVEDLWCLYSYDITLKPFSTIIKMKQQYAPIKGNNYLPINFFAKATVGIMGFKADLTYTTTIKYDSVIINPEFDYSRIKKSFDYKKLIEDSKYEQKEDSISAKNKKIEEIDKKLNTLLQKEEPTTREMIKIQKLMSKKASIVKVPDSDNQLEIKTTYKQHINKDALKHDSTYWDSVRPVPISENEKISYKEIKKEKTKEDSSSTFSKVLNTMFFGNHEWERKKKFHIYYPGLINTRNVGFNPVDGLQIKQSFKIRWRYDSLNYVNLKAKAGYSFERETVFGNGSISLSYSPKLRGYLNISGGYYTANFQNTNTINENLNAIYNLMSKQNYIKFYNNTYIRVNNQIDVANGTQWYIGFKWQKTDTLSNNTNFSFLYPNKEYEPNVPINENITASNLNPSKMINFSTGFYYTPKYYYRLYKGRKHYVKTKYPTFGLFYSIAPKINSDYSQYQSVRFSINHKIKFYGISSIRYSIKSAIYFNTENVHFSNFNHFNTIQEIFTTRGFKNAFYLLNNYEYSTISKYFEGHFKYTTQFLLLKRLPWISNTMWSENLFANILLVEGYFPYYEAGYAIEDIFFQGKAGVFAGFKGSSFHSVGLRVSFVF
jgi:hypothetical protein